MMTSVMCSLSYMFILCSGLPRSLWWSTASLPLKISTGRWWWYVTETDSYKETHSLAVLYNIFNAIQNLLCMCVCVCVFVYTEQKRSFQFVHVVFVVLKNSLCNEII